MLRLRRLFVRLFAPKTRYAGVRFSDLSHPFVKTCFDFDVDEGRDERTYLDFADQLKRIDALCRRSGKKRERELTVALSLARKGLAEHPDCYLFFNRMAAVLFALDRYGEAETLLIDALAKSRSKSEIANELGEFGMRRGEFDKAVLWWVRACALQMKAKSLFFCVPFLNLAHVAEQCGARESAVYLFALARRADPSAPPALGPEDAEQRYKIARFQLELGDDRYLQAIVHLCSRYPRI